MEVIGTGTIVIVILIGVSWWKIHRLRKYDPDKEMNRNNVVRIMDRYSKGR